MKDQIKTALDVQCEFVAYIERAIAGHKDELARLAPMQKTQAEYLAYLKRLDGVPMTAFTPASEDATIKAMAAKLAPRNATGDA